MAALSHELRGIRDILRSYVGSPLQPTQAALRGLATSIDMLALRSELLESRALDAEALEAVSRELDPCSAQVALQRSLTEQQRVIQRRLDAGEALS